jgi:molybdopterin molybdotransferase
VSQRSGELELEDARRLVMASISPLMPTVVELDGALGRVLGEDVVARNQLPAFDSSAMDGFAVKALDVAAARPQEPVELRIVGESRAGYPAEPVLQSGEAIAISTGAMIPAGADAVVRVERTSPAGEGSVLVLEPVRTGAEVRRAGEDVQAGQLVMGRGERLAPPQIGMLAALGRESVMCGPSPGVSVLVTGDELLGAGAPARAGGVSNSNSHSIGAMVRCAGARLVSNTTAGDDVNDIATAIAAAAAASDLLVICGGLSVGEHDHVRPALSRLGAHERFWGLALKPGHPTWFGELDGVPVFGLPGNPVSAMVTFILLVAPALIALQGVRLRNEIVTAVLEGGYRKASGRTHAIPCRLHIDDGGWRATPVERLGSHIQSSMAAADALALIPSDVTEVAAGARVRIEPIEPWHDGPRG